MTGTRCRAYNRNTSATSAADYNEARKDGKPVSVVYPDADGIGTVIVPNCAVLIAGGPNATNGRKFIDFLLAPESEQALAEGDAAQMPLRTGVAVPPHVIPVDRLKPMPLDYAKLGTTLDEISRSFLKEWVDKNSR